MAGLGHPIINQWSDFTAQPAEFTAHISSIPTLTFGGSAPNRYMDVAGATNDHMRKPIQVAGSNVANVRMDVLYETYTNLTSTPGTGQLMWTAANAENIAGTSSFVGELYVSDLGDKSRITRRTGVTSASNGSASSVLNLGTAPTLSTSTLYWKRFERIGSGSSRTYNSAYYTNSSFALGSLVASSSSTTGALSDAGTDAEDNYFTIATGAPTKIYAVILYKISSPNITAQPSAQSKAEGETATWNVTAQQGDAVTGHTLSYQWKRSSTQNGTYSNVSGGSGATTNSYTTAALTNASDNGFWYKCVITDDTNSETNETTPVQLSVSIASGPIFSSAVTANLDAGGHNRLDVTFSNTGSGLTLLSSSTAKWSATKVSPQGATITLTITAVAVSGNDARLTIAERILASDTTIRVSLLANDAIEASGGANADTFSNQVVTNASTRDFGITLTSPFNEVCCFVNGSAADGRWFQRVGATRTASHAASLTLTMTPPASMPSLALSVASQPGTGTLGTGNITAPSTSHDLTGSATCTFTLADAYGNIRTATAPVYVCDRYGPVFDETLEIGAAGTSTAVNWTADGFINNFYAKYGDVADALYYAHQTITHLFGEYGQSGQTTAAWAVNHANGFPNILLAGAVKRGIKILIYANSYLNDATAAFTWTDLKPETATTYQYFADNFPMTLSCEMSGRYDQAQTGAGNISSATTTTVTVTGSSGTVDGTSANKFVGLNRATGSRRMFRKINTVDDLGGGAYRFNLDVTDSTLGDGTAVEGDLPEVPVGTFFVTPTTYEDRAISHNTGRLELCEGGANATVGTYGGRIVPINSGILKYGRDHIKNNDNLHLETTSEGSGFHVDLLRRIGLQAVIAENAAVALTAPSSVLAPGGGLQLTLVMSGAGFGNSYFPDDFRLDGTWSLQANTTGGGGITSGGFVTAGGSPGTIVALFTSAHTPYGDAVPLTATFTISVAPLGSSGIVPGASGAILGRGRQGVVAGVK